MHFERVGVEAENSDAARTRAEFSAWYGRDEDSGLVVDYSYGDADEMPRFVKGERVRHPQFGSGIIRELSGLGTNMKAVIDFDGNRKPAFTDLQRAYTAIDQYPGDAGR